MGRLQIARLQLVGSNSVCVRQFPSARSAGAATITHSELRALSDDRVRILSSEILADDWARLTKYTIDFTRSDGRAVSSP